MHHNRVAKLHLNRVTKLHLHREVAPKLVEKLRLNNAYPNCPSTVCRASAPDPCRKDATVAPKPCREDAPQPRVA